MDKLEVIKVECKDSDCGWKLINKEDMKPEHKEFKIKPEKKKKKKIAKKEDK